MTKFAQQITLRMFTRSSIKIQIALLVFVAFLFRMVFVNVTIIPGVNLAQNKKVALSHFSNILKKRKTCSDVANKAAFEMAEEEALCEENSGSEEDFSKVSSPAVLSVFHSGLKPMNLVSRANGFLESNKYDLHSKRYLSLSVLRI